MSGHEVPAKVTPPDPAAWRAAFVLAVYTATGHAPSDAAMSVCWAQWALETGRGVKCECNNIGNIMPGPSWEGDWCLLPTWELVGDKRENVIEKFRAYDFLSEGMVDYVGFLMRPRYARAWLCILAGDAVAFAQVLHELGYYTAPVTDYANGLRSLAAEFLRMMRATLTSVMPPVFTSEEQTEHDAAEAAMGESLPLACYDTTSLEAALTIRSTCHDTPAMLAA